jgi:hypothetical protein
MKGSNPCYRRESLPINRNCKKTKAQEAVGKHPTRKNERIMGTQ